MYYKAKKSAWLSYFETCFVHNIEEVSDRRLHDSLSLYYIDEESCPLYCSCSGLDASVSARGEMLNLRLLILELVSNW